MKGNVYPIRSVGRSKQERIAHLDMDELLNEFDVQQESGSDTAWAVGYLDILLLLLTLFAVLLAITYMNSGGSQALPHEVELALKMPLQERPLTLDPAVILTAFQTKTTASAKVAEPAPVTVKALSAVAAVSVQPVTTEIITPLLPPALARVAGILSSRQGEQFDLLVDKRQLRLEMSDDILFSPANADLDGEGRLLLSQLVDNLLNEDFDIIVEGHTDDLPIATQRFPSNWELSTFRASSVARYLIDQGIQRGRVQVIGYADTRPLLPNSSRQNRAKNRRVSVVLRLPEWHMGANDPLADPMGGSGIEHL